jgi:hypothetical protein
MSKQKFNDGQKVILIKEEIPHNTPSNPPDLNYAIIVLTHANGISLAGYSELRIKFGTEGTIESISHGYFKGYYLVDFKINNDMSLALDVPEENLIEFEEFHSTPIKFRKMWL